MLKKLPIQVAVTTVLALILTVIMAGCGSSASQSAPDTSGQSVQQSETQTTQQPSTSSGQPSGTQSGQKAQAPVNSNMDAVLARAAEILGVSTASFKTAFENAMPKGGGSGSSQTGQQGPPPGDNTTGRQGQPPSGQPPAAPSGSTTGQQPSGGQGAGPSMTAVYTAMATELNLTADAIEKAMTQAQQELLQK